MAGLLFGASAVARQGVELLLVVGSAVEGIAQEDAWEGLVVAGGSSLPVSFFDFDGGDVVGQQQYFVGVYLFAVFAVEVFVFDERPAVAAVDGEQPVDEGAGSGERVQHMNVPV